MILFAKHRHNAKTIKQCDRNRKAAEAALTSVTKKTHQHTNTKNNTANKIK